MKDNFELILDFVLEHEGGLVDDPVDPGGITNLGISFRLLQDLPEHLADITKDGIIDEQDIVNITIESAAGIYKEIFWNKCKCDELPDNIDCVVFDSAVNMGCSAAIKLLQKTLNKMGYDVEVDGGLGPVTLNLIQSVDSDVAARHYLDLRLEFYNSLVNKKPAFKKYIKGWTKRVNELSNFIGV